MLQRRRASVYNRYRTRRHDPQLENVKMSRRLSYRVDRIGSLIILAWWVGWSGLGRVPVQAGQPTGTSTGSDRPNILFIFTDDHACQSISAYGSRINQTPNIDRLARAGMRFDRCLVTNSICGPSRAVIQTGKYSHLNGFLQNGNRFDNTQQTFPKLLRQSGYQTAIIGKWHLGCDPTGFDYWRILPGQGNYYNPDFLSAEGRERIEGYVTDVTTDLALEWLEGRDRDRPFMLMLQHKAPHRAWLPGPKHLTMYQDQAIPEPENLFDDYRGRAPVLAENAMEVGRDMRPGYDLKLFADDTTPAAKRFFKRFTPEQKSAWLTAYRGRWEDYQKRRATVQNDRDLRRMNYQYYIKDYLRCIASVDDNVGRVLDYLEEKGLAEDTIVIYSSDQGFYLGEHGWYDKRWIFEESLRTPLIVRWPGVTQPGTSCNRIVSNLDFAETFLDLAGVPIPDDMQGRSLVPILRGHVPEDWRTTFYYRYYELGTHNVAQHEGVVTDRYKLVHYLRHLNRSKPKGQRVEPVDQWDLIDRQADPREMHSYHGDPGYAQIQQELENEMARLRQEFQVVDD